MYRAYLSYTIWWVNRWGRKLSCSYKISSKKTAESNKISRRKLWLWFSRGWSWELVTVFRIGPNFFVIFGVAGAYEVKIRNSGFGRLWLCGFNDWRWRAGLFVAAASSFPTWPNFSTSETFIFFQLRKFDSFDWGFTRIYRKYLISFHDSQKETVKNIIKIIEKDIYIYL